MYITKEEYKAFYWITDDSQDDLIDAKILQAENLINDRLNIETFNKHIINIKRQYIEDWFYRFKTLKINRLLSINWITDYTATVFNYSIMIVDYWNLINSYFNEPYLVFDFELEIWYDNIPYLVKEVMYKVVNYLINNINTATSQTVAWFEPENIKSFKQGDLSITLKDWSSTDTSTTSNFMITKNIEDEIKRLNKFIWSKRQKIYHN